MKIYPQFDPPSCTWTYLVWDPDTKDSCVVDPVLDFEPTSKKISFGSLNKLIQVIKKENLKVHRVFETHVHADHLTSSYFLKTKLPGLSCAISEDLVLIQKIYKDKLPLPQSFDTKGSQYDHLLKDEEEISLGSLRIKVLKTPGHTPSCMCFLIQDEYLFTGDTLFMPDFGTGRCDFPGGSPSSLYHSVNTKLYKLPSSTKIFVCHDYMPGGRQKKYETTLDAQKKENIHLKLGTSLNDFIEFRTKRDQALKPPRLLESSLRVNLNGGLLDYL